jgi:ABC-2 type transport system permease protein
MFLARDPEFLAIQLIYPVIVLIVFGLVFSVTARELPIAVRDLDGSPSARRLVHDLVQSGYFKTIQTGTPERAFDRGEASVLLTIPPTAEKRIRRGHDPNLSFELDGADFAAARAAEDYLRTAPDLIRRPNREARSGRQGAGFAPSIVDWFNPEARDTDFFVPSVIALIVFGAPVIFTSLALVRERRRGTWVAMRLAPVSAVELYLGRLFPYLVESTFVAATAFGAARIVFGLPLRGDGGLVAAMTVVYALTGVTFGIVIASVSNDEDTAWQYIQLYVLSPALVLSGAIYPLASQPRLVQVLSFFSPIRWYLEFVRGSCLKGATLDELATPVGALCAFAAGMVLLALFLLARDRRAES